MNSDLLFLGRNYCDGMLNKKMAQNMNISAEYSTAQRYQDEHPYAFIFINRSTNCDKNYRVSINYLTGYAPLYFTKS